MPHPRNILAVVSDRPADRSGCGALARALGIGVWLLLLLVTPSWGVNPATRITQYAHTAWRIQDAVFSGAPNAITQTPDGYIWIGTQSGLVRFDGVRFVPWSPPAGQVSLTSNSIYSLLPDRDGSLWIGTGSELAHWVNGQLVLYSNARGRINSILQDRDGKIWITRSRVREPTGPLCEVSGTELRCHGNDEGFKVPYAGPMVVDAAGNFWIGSASSLTRWRDGSATVITPPALRSAEGLSGLQSLAILPDGRLLIGMTRSGPGLGLQLLDRQEWKPFVTGSLDWTTQKISTLYVDRQQTLWIGTEDNGIYRVQAGQVDRFFSADGLSGDTVRSFFEDREGNLWVVTSEGIDCFHDLRVITFSTREGLTSNEVNSVAAASDGTVWFGNHGALDFLRLGKLGSITASDGLPGTSVTALFADRDGLLWVGVDNGLTVCEGGKFYPIRHRDGTPTGPIIALTQDRNRDIWARSLGNPRKLIRIRDRVIQEEILETLVPRGPTLAADPTDGIWLGLADGKLARFRSGKLETFSYDLKESVAVRQVLVRPDGTVLGATSAGLIGWKNGTQRIMTVKNGLPCDRIFGLIDDAQDGVWLYSECGLVRIEAGLDQWWENPGAVVGVQVFDVFDGARPAMPSFQPIAARGPDGRLWFANETVIQMIDPAHLTGNRLPPPVHIEGMTADRKDYPTNSVILLPAQTRDLEIDYTALSFVAPQKMRFRYRLEGRDAEWQEAGTRRQAFYSDLRPGSYRFRVIASNNDGVWNEVGATLDFTIPPAWFQTVWFRIAAILAVLLVVFAIYRLRVRQIAHELNARFDERLAERTRLARELHDTFLQTIQGSKMVADDALDQPADPVRLRRTLEQLSVWLGQAVTEGRAALNSLRSSTTEKNDLASALRRATETTVSHGSMTVGFNVFGESKDMHPIVRDEVYRIGYEAIRNACTHSGATNVDVELRYENDLVVRIKDNGVGIDETTVAEGKVGHFGLTGMRERARRIGADLTINSSPDSGTEVALVVPGGIAFHLTSHLK